LEEFTHFGSVRPTQATQLDAQIVTQRRDRLGFEARPQMKRSVPRQCAITLRTNNGKSAEQQQNATPQRLPVEQRCVVKLHREDEGVVFQVFSW
jgi:hypothetical protein